MTEQIHYSHHFSRQYIELNKIKRIAILFEEEFLGVYPSLINTIKILSENKYYIDIITVSRNSGFPQPPQFGKNVRYFSIKQYSEYDRNYFSSDTIINSNFESKSSHWLKSIIPEFIKVKYRFIKYLISINIDSFGTQLLWLFDKIKYVSACFINHLIYKYKILIAIDNTGLIASAFIGPFNRPIVYNWSLEIDTNKTDLLFYRIFDTLYTFLIRRNKNLIIQDSSRLNVLSKHYSLNAENKCVFWIPHSPIGSDRIIESNYFQKKFNFSTTDKIILHAGWIHDAMCVDKIAIASKYWKSNYKLVLHEREKRSPKDPFIQHVNTLSGNRTYLSLNPVNFDLIDQVFSSAHIGIIAYDKNYGGGRENVFKASGKLGQYLKCGVPVIALNLPGYNELFSKYKCGLVFNHFEEIENCIDQVLLNYSSFREECFKCFNEEFDFRKFFKPLLSSINSNTFYLRS